MARQGEAQHDGKGGGEFLGDAWKLRGAGGGAGRWLSTAGGRRTALAASKQASRQGKKTGTQTKFPKFQGPICKTSITIKLGLK